MALTLDTSATIPSVPELTEEVQLSQLVTTRNDYPNPHFGGKREADLIDNTTVTSLTIATVLRV